MFVKFIIIILLLISQDVILLRFHRIIQNKVNYENLVFKSKYRPVLSLRTRLQSSNQDIEGSKQIDENVTNSITLDRPINPITEEEMMTEEEQQQIAKAEAMELLDCLTSPKDTNDPKYNAEKDIRRDELLQDTDYEELKVECRSRGLRTTGDKLEMILRILLHIIDPTVKYSESSGRGVTLKYIDKEDLESKNARIVSESERIEEERIDFGPDADDLQVLKKRRTLISSTSSSNTTRSKPQYKPRSDDKEKIVMDGLVRKEIGYDPVRINREESIARLQDIGDIVIRAYVVGGRDVLRTWDKISSVVILLPDENGWQSANIRIIADEIAFYHQSIVLVPDLFRGYIGSEVIYQCQRYPERVIDDIIATFHYIKTEYHSKAISLAGIGIGAKLALETSCDLVDIASFAELRYLRSQSSVNRITEKNKNKDSKMNKNSNDDNDDNNIDMVSSLSFADADVVNPYVVNTKKSRLLFPKQEETLESILRDDLMTEIQNHTEYESIVNSLAKSIANNVSDNIPNNITDFIEKSNEEDNEKDNELDVDLMKRIPTKTEQTKTLLFTKNKIEEQRNINTQRALDRNLIGSYPSIPIVNLRYIRPISVVAWNPISFDYERVGQSIQIPVLVICNHNNSLSIRMQRTSESAIKLHDILQDRKEDILDFSFRSYTISNENFLCFPVTDNEKKAAQDAILLGSYWLDIYSRYSIDDYLDGVGDTKSKEPFQIISKSQLDRLEVRGSPVATYLHTEEKDLFKNDRLPSDEVMRERSK